MKFDWRFFANMAIPFIEKAGRDYIGKDVDDVGKDDIIGQSLVYIAKLLSAIINDVPTLPKAPVALR